MSQAHRPIWPRWHPRHFQMCRNRYSSRYYLVWASLHLTSKFLGYFSYLLRRDFHVQCEIVHFGLPLKFLGYSPFHIYWGEVFTRCGVVHFGLHFGLLLNVFGLFITYLLGRGFHTFHTLILSTKFCFVHITIHAQDLN